MALRHVTALPPKFNQFSSLPSMSHTLAERLLDLVGPGRLLFYGCPDVAIITALLQRGCDVWSIGISPAQSAHGNINRLVQDSDLVNMSAFDTVVLCGNLVAKSNEPSKLLYSLRSHTVHNLVLCFDELECRHSWSGGHLLLDNQKIEELVLAAGFRRHPASFPVSRYQRLNDPTPERFLCFEKIADATLARWPLEFLLANRDLHMDMSREVGPRSDAHLVRYALAAEWVRPGDTVLDCACGLGYGSAILAAASRGKRFIGIDIDEESIKYARENFNHYPVEYIAASAIKLDFLTDHSVDFVVSFETIEHLENYELFLDEVRRILTPDGRLICSVPNLWVDETGQDPNPYHYHAFNYSGIRSALKSRFIVEARYAQTAPGGFKLTAAQRYLEQQPLREMPVEADSEWLILIASANVSNANRTEYRQPEFDPCTKGTASQLTAFGTYYDNPWIYRQIIQNGQRISDPEVLNQLIHVTISNSSQSSADYGGLLTVLAYQGLQGKFSIENLSLLEKITDYLQLTTENPHIHRWQISLAYVAALINLSAGNRVMGEEFLRKVTLMDPLRFSPLITTKTIAAHFILGIINLVDGNQKSAHLEFTSAILAARRALHAPDTNAIGNPHHPLSFGFFELAEIADMAGQCAIAINNLEYFHYSPGLFWRSIDVKRFGLLTWLRHLEGEIENLEREIKNNETQHKSEIERLRLEHHELRQESNITFLITKRIKEALRKIIYWQ